MASDFGLQLDANSAIPYIGIPRDRNSEYVYHLSLEFAMSKPFLLPWILAILGLSVTSSYLTHPEPRTTAEPHSDDPRIRPASYETGEPVGAPRLVFYENGGQLNDDVLFHTRSGNESIHFLADRIRFNGRAREGVDRLELRFRYADPHVSLRPGPRLNGVARFYRGSAADARTVAMYDEITYEELYQGIDLLYGATRDGLKSEFHLEPGANASAIRLVYNGALTVTVAQNGTLVVTTPAGRLTESPPYAYQEVDGERREVAAAYRVFADFSVGFEVTGYDAGLPLVIDPDVLYLTYVGGTNEQIGTGVELDSDGNLIVTGTTFSADFPVVNAQQDELSGSSDMFVVKIDPTSGDYIFATFLGGSAGDAASDVALDEDDNMFVCGSSASTNFPVASPVQETLSGDRDAVLVELSPNGMLSYATYLGGTGFDHCYGVAVSPAGEVVMGGYTNSDDFPTSDPLQGSRSGDDDGWVAKLNAAGKQLVYSTYVGGVDRDRVRKVDVDADGQAVVTGETESSDFPTASALQAQPGGVQDGFVSKLTAAGDQLVYSTYLGGSKVEYAWDVALDAEGNAYVGGTTLSEDFPTQNAIFPTGGALDGFITKLDPAGAVVYSTYIGGQNDDTIRALDVDEFGDVVAVGYTDGFDLPAGKASWGATLDNPAFAVNLLPNGIPIGVVRTGGMSYTEWFAVAARGGKAAVAGDRDVNGANVSTDGSEPASTSSYDCLAGIIELPLGAPRADMMVTKTGPGKAVENVAYSYTVKVKNIGPSVAENAYAKDTISRGLLIDSVVTSQEHCDVVDGGVDCSFGSLGPGQEVTLQVFVKASGDSTQPTPFTVTNQVMTGSDVDDPSSANNVASVSTEIVRDGFVDLSVEKTAFPLLPQGESSLGSDSVSSALGYHVEFRITVRNAGPDEAVNVTIMDPLPEGVRLEDVLSGDCDARNGSVVCRLGNLKAGEKKEVSLIVSGLEEGAWITNTATVSNARLDLDSSDNSDGASVRFVAGTTLKVELSVPEGGFPIATRAGVSATVTNIGQEVAYGTWVDLLPVDSATLIRVVLSPGSCPGRDAREEFPVNTNADVRIVCEIGTLGPGQSKAIDFDIVATERPFHPSLRSRASADNAALVVDSKTIFVGEGILESLFRFQKNGGESNKREGEIDVYVDDQRVVDDLAPNATSPIVSATITSTRPTIDYVEGSAGSNDDPIASFTVDLISGDSSNFDVTKSLAFFVIPSGDTLGQAVGRNLRPTAEDPGTVGIMFLNAYPGSPVDAVVIDTSGQHHVVVDLGDTLGFGISGPYASLDPGPFALRVSSLAGESEAFGLDLTSEADRSLIAAVVENADAGKRTGQAAFALIVFDTEGNPIESPVVTGLDAPGTVPATFALSTAYPNPFRAHATIGYTLPEASKVEITVVDLRGRLVARLVDVRQTAGAYVVDWNAGGANGANLASGVYFVRMRAGNFTSSREAVIVR